jgi:predicted dehydrogenase
MVVMRDLRIGVVGYGTGGQNFHTPFIEAAEGIELCGVVTRSPERRSAVARDWPGVSTYDSLEALLAAGVDAVTITTPPTTRRALVLQAVAAGVHVVADKPFAPTAEIGREMARAADEAGVMLSVFHNRRWDADIRTLAGVLASRELGELWRVHSRFDLDDPSTLEAGEGGGLLRDIGSHVVDQMLWLLGPARAVTAHLDWIELPDGRTDAGFAIDLLHTSGVSSQVEASKVNHIAARELRAYGSEGSYTALGADVQAQAIFAGQRPAHDPEGWGYDAPENWGVLATASGSRPVPSEQGAYQDLYTQFAAAVRGDALQPVPAAEGVRVLEVLDAARVSDAQCSSVQVEPVQ